MMKEEKEEIKWNNGDSDIKTQISTIASIIII